MANTVNVDYGKLPETLEAIAEWFCRNTAASRGTIMPATCLDAATAIRVLMEQVKLLKSNAAREAKIGDVNRVLQEIEARITAEAAELKKAARHDDKFFSASPLRIGDSDWGMGEEYGSNPGQLNEHYG